MKNTLVFYVYLAGISLMGCCCHIPYSAVENLYDSLLSNYNTRIRPLKDQTSTLVLRAHFAPAVVISLHTSNQMLSIFGVFTLQWNDDFLQWNTTEYDGVKTVKLSIKDIWHSDMLLNPAYHDRQIVGSPDSKVTVTSTGRVRWSVEGVYTVVCQMDTTYYPFDTQGCTVHLYVADHTSDEVLLQLLNGGLSTRFTTENSEWEASDSTVEIHFYQEKAIQLLRYRFLFSRRPSFIMYTTVGPIVLLAFLNSFVFLVPISSGEKGSIAVTVLLSFSVYISSVSSALPSNSLHSPLLFIVMTILEIHSAIIVLIVIVESRIHHMTDGQTCLQQLFGSRYSGHEINDEDGNMDSGKSVYPKTQENAYENDNNHSFKKSDLALFSISLILNIVTLSVFAYGLNKGMRHTF